MVIKGLYCRLSDQNGAPFERACPAALLQRRARGFYIAGDAVSKGDLFYIFFGKNLYQCKQRLGRDVSAIATRSNVISERVHAWMPRNLTAGISSSLHSPWATMHLDDGLAFSC